MKKFHLHLDALIVIVVLFVVSLGINFAQYRIYAELVAENQDLQMQALVDDLNLGEMDKTIKRLQAEQQAASGE